MSDVLRRADRAAAFALIFVLAAAVGTASAGDNPSTDHQQTNHQSTAQLRGTVADLDSAASVPQLPLAEDAITAAPSAVEVAMVQLAAEERCLAEAMYYEARGEGLDGEMAIAEVVFHRMHRRGYPGSICGVVYQGVGNGVGCQFSFVCDGEMTRSKAHGDWARAKNLAAKILAGYTPLGNSTGGAISFHAADIEPDWSANLERTVQIGNHVFYRPLSHTRAS